MWKGWTRPDTGPIWQLTTLVTFSKILNLSDSQFPCIVVTKTGKLLLLLFTESLLNVGTILSTLHTLYIILFNLHFNPSR